MTTKPPHDMKKVNFKKKLSKNAMVALNKAEVALMFQYKLKNLHQKKNSN